MNENSVFHPDNLPIVTLITLLHIKDYLAIIAGQVVSPDIVDKMEELHDEGLFLCPAPLAPDDSDVTDE